MPITSLSALDASIAALCLSFSCILFRTRHYWEEPSGLHPQAYVVQNQVTHARLLPAKSSHAFTYPTLSLLVSLNALENHSLDLGRGWIFGYGGLWGRIAGIRPKPYLVDGNAGQTIREKLEAVLEKHGVLETRSAIHDAWMMTMPSYLGIEGINPLTVYFCYKPEGSLWLVVLEVRRLSTSSASV